MDNRTIAHMDLDTFFVSCERLINNKLIGKPIIIGGSSNRGVVSSCSYEARYFGVRSAMPVRHALHLCPDAIVVKGDMDLYSKQSKLVTEIIKDTAPIYEKASIDEFYLDLTGMDRFFGSYNWTNELVSTIQKECGLPISFGLSCNKTVAKIATGEGKPKGKIEVIPQYVRPFLNPLSIKKIPMLGDKTYKVLSRVGIRQIQTLADMPEDVLLKLLGKNGKTLHRKANGIDSTPIVQYNERKSISTERTFDKDSMDLNMLHALLHSFVEKLCYQLRKEQKMTSIVSVKLRYTNFDTYTNQCKISYTSCDHVIKEKVKGLFNKLYERRMRIRLIGLKFSGLVQGNYQISLLDDTEQSIRLYQAMDRIRNRFGDKSIRSAATMRKYSTNQTGM